MFITEFSQGVPLIDSESIEARRIFFSPGVAAVQIVLQPGAVIEPHETTEDVFFYVITGEPTITVAEDTRKVGAENLVECTGGVIKGMKNEGTEVAKVLVVKMKPAG